MLTPRQPHRVTTGSEGMGDGVGVEGGGSERKKSVNNLRCRGLGMWRGLTVMWGAECGGA